MTDKNTIKNWFKTGLKPTQAQFWATWDSFWHKDEKIPIAAIDDIENILNAKAEAEVLTHHLTTATAHASLFEAKEDKSQKGVAGGYVPLNEIIKISSQYLSIVDDLFTGGSSQLLSAEQGKLLKTQIDAINLLLTSDNVNLDNLQELVDAIETAQTSLSTILVNDLTTGGTTKALTAEMGKTLKGLIDALTTSISGKISTIITTVKTITSANLTTQDVAGFVAYVNALGAPLVVAANEIVEYQLSDTGRVFKLLLRGRSFGTGQPAITSADVEEITLWMQKDLKLSNYPSTRNDGQLPTNKVLAPDVNGNLKLYTIATAPAPYMEVLIPDSTLPSTTTNFTIKGAFFTPTMTVSIVGQTINYITFVSDNLVKVNVTTGATEGSFAVTLNNGLSATFPNALLIVLGTVFKPVVPDWTAVTGNIDVITEGEVHSTLYNSLASAKWSKFFDNAKKYSVKFNLALSPLGIYNSAVGTDTVFLSLVNTTTGVEDFKFTIRADGFPSLRFKYFGPSTSGYVNSTSGTNYSEALTYLANQQLEFRKISATMYVYYNNALVHAFPETISSNYNLLLRVKSWDVVNIKYIELV